MAASGPPSQRKLSVSSLVYSTLGPSLGLLPSEEKTVLVEEEDEAEVQPETSEEAKSRSDAC